MKQGEVSKLKDKLREQIAFIESEQAVIDTILDDIEELTKGISDKGVTRKKLEELQTLDGELSSKLKSLRKEIDFYEHNDNCPTCKQGIEHDFKTETVSGNSSKAQDIEVARKELGFRGLKVEERLKEIDLVEDDINSKNLDASGHRANHKMALNSCRHIKTELDEAENEVIAIDSNEIKDQGAQALGNVLENNKSLQFLDLWKNRIGSEGFICFIKKLKNNKNIRGMNLGYNRMGNEGCVELAEYLKINTSIKNLDLGNYCFILLADKCVPYLIVCFA
jgi:hypothetical protein